MWRTSVCVGAVLVLSAGCGGSDGDSESSDDPAAAPAAPAEEESGGDAPDVADATTFGGELEDGTTLTVRLDVDESDPIIAPFVAFREQAGVSDDVVWMVGSLESPADYDDALGPPTGRFLTFVPPGGERVADSNPTSTFACGLLDDWFGTPSGDEGVALNEAYIEIVDSSCGNQTLGVIGEIGATTDYAMLFEGSNLPEFESVWAGLLTELEPIG